MNRTVLIENIIPTCEPSAYLLNQAAAFLKANGYTVVQSGGNGSEIVVVNTCCVTRDKQRACERRIDNIIQHMHPGKLVLFGCLAETTRKYREGDGMHLVGPKNLGKLHDIFSHRIPIDRVFSPRIDHAYFTPCQTHLTHKDYFVMICQGCENRCTYCNIKNAKGSVRSREKEKILSEVQKGLLQGVSEIMLLADDCGSYGLDIGSDTAELVDELLGFDDRLRLKFNYFFPGRFVSLYPRLRKWFKAHRISYVNLPIQSASPRILKLMNRGYRIRELADVIADLRRISPETWLYTHVMINFPTETRSEFTESLKASLLFDERMIISYSDNPETPANHILPKVKEAEKNDRIRAGTRFLKTNNIDGFVVKTGSKESIPAFPEGNPLKFR